MGITLFMEFFLQTFRIFQKFSLTINLIIVSFICFTLSSCEPENNNNIEAVSALALVANNRSTGSTSDNSCSSAAYCKIFVSTASYPALNTNLGISGLDSYCNNATDKPSGGGTYKALVTDETTRIACTTANCSGGPSEHADWVLKANKQYRQSDGTTVIGTTNANGLFTFPLTNPPRTNWTGTMNTATGLRPNWTSSNNHCTGWRAGGTFMAAQHNDTSSLAISNAGTMSCTDDARIICVEQ